MTQLMNKSMDLNMKPNTIIRMNAKMNSMQMNSI